MNMFKFEFKRLLKGSIIWSLVCSALIVMFMLFFPSMKEMGMQELVGSKLEVLPEAFLEAFNISGATDFSNISDFSAYVLQYIIMAGGIYAAILGVSALVKEESEGTIEFLYSKPVTRNKIITAKVLANAVIFYIFLIILGAITMAVSAVVKPEDIEMIDMFMDIKTLYIGMALIGYIFMAIGFLISVFIKSSKKAIPIALGVFFASYILGIFSKLQDRLSGFIYFSPFDYAPPSEIIKNGFETKFIVIGLCIIFISITITYIMYNKKDFN
ncbi:ABC transporter permease subunit [Clostridium celatum]|uniref:ABC transporter, permease family protein n=1 Tax=Clostridium celatum DSM 1785 TaxID=545697 RepID=L1QLU5_9CLOT|nr:ABC transporter permease subunit [Clostridium celatum]EKY28901.1 ABC transporter, permease family protein [Clostridium celatum DSM 1785]MCE9655044.1 ABC transporter permease [Clostridium celatum]MDU2266469.1 ABC transporter permease subunit [Clostridium celatum]MDU3722114.1 ABC transporter permease subunit [Clostridium celatum]MDU6296771.1 ABC transporter permease subunit [Clostridium celatum]